MLALDPGTTLSELQQALAASETLVITTSGSTGSPKRVAVTAEALAASVRASAAVIGAGNWYLCLPLHYVAGVQVVNRARLAGGELVTAEQAPSFAAAVKALPMPRYTSVVPAQLQAAFEQSVDDDPVVAAAGEAELMALAQFSRILVGGQALPERLARRCRAAGMRLVETYGSSETSGGCVYDGEALPGVRVAIAADGRISLGGPTVAEGYLDAHGQLDAERTAAHFGSDADTRWYRTDDRGEWVDGRLRVLGRIDDVIISGGLKLDLAEVQHWLDQHQPGTFSFAAPSQRWGQSLGVFLPTEQQADAERLREQLVTTFGPQAQARIVSASIAPRLPSGKLDRQTLASMVGDEYQAEAQPEVDAEGQSHPGA